MNSAEIEAKIKSLTDNVSKKDFIYELLLAYDLPKASITRLQVGNLNLSKIEGEILWKKKLFVKAIPSGERHTLALNALSEREKHSEKTFAQLYDPDKMPAGLREAHQQLDLAVERCYRSKPFESDEERLEYLFILYEKMTRRKDNLI